MKFSSGSITVGCFGDLTLPSSGLKARHAGAISAGEHRLDARWARQRFCRGEI